MGVDVERLSQQQIVKSGRDPGRAGVRARVSGSTSAGPAKRKRITAGPTRYSLVMSPARVAACAKAESAARA